MVSVKWVETYKGTEEDPEIRCSFVARDIQGSDKDRVDVFAATPLRDLLLLLFVPADAMSPWQSEGYRKSAET